MAFLERVGPGRIENYTEVREGEGEGEGEGGPGFFQEQRDFLKWQRRICRRPENGKIIEWFSNNTLKGQVFQVQPQGHPGLQLGNNKQDNNILGINYEAMRYDKTEESNRR